MAEKSGSAGGRRAAGNAPADTGSATVRSFPDREADPVSAGAFPAALRPPADPLFSATSPPCPPLAQRVCPSDGR